MSVHDFKLESPPRAKTTFRPKEPLYSLLRQMPLATLKFTLEQLNNYQEPAELDDVLPETGLTRRETIEHVLHVLEYDRR